MIANTALSLCYLLQAEIRQLTAGLRVSDSMISPNVFVGKLPKREAIFQPDEVAEIVEEGVINWGEVKPPNIQVPEMSEETVFPYIIIRPTDNADEAKEADGLGALASITITVASESYADNGFVDVCHLLEVIRINLLEKEIFSNAVIQRPLVVSYPNFEDFSTQNHYFGDMFLKFEMPTIEKRRSYL